MMVWVWSACGLAPPGLGSSRGQSACVGLLLAQTYIHFHASLPCASTDCSERCCCVLCEQSHGILNTLHCTCLALAWPYSFASASPA